MVIRPISRRCATEWVARYHRHLPKSPPGWLFGVGVYKDNRLVGVAFAGRPAARALQDGVTCEITRVCTDGTRNACSAAYGALRRAASALGYRRVVTYTRADEDAASVRASGFVRDGCAGGGEWGRRGRVRVVQDQSPKVRWIWSRP